MLPGSLGDQRGAPGMARSVSPGDISLGGPAGGFGIGGGAAASSRGIARGSPGPSGISGAGPKAGPGLTTSPSRCRAFEIASA